MLKRRGAVQNYLPTVVLELKTVEKLSDAGLDVYHVSLPTLNTEKFASLRIGNEKILKRVLESVTFALESTRMSVTIETLAVKDLLHEMPALYDYWSNLGVKTFEVQTPVLLGRMDEKLLPDTHKLIEVLKDLYERRIPRTTIKVNCLWFTCLHPEIMHALSEILFEECECGTHTLNIKADGKVTICPFADFSVGDIRKQTLKEIYNSAFLRKYRVTFNEDCYSCLLFKNCHGRCRLMPYMQGKDFSKNPMRCLRKCIVFMKPGHTRCRDA
jgi:radical SAM protein with 4Fe4S-binding SPASM domain